MVHVETVTDPEGFGKLRDEWDELLDQSRSNSLFLTWEWLSTWWKHLAERRTLSLITARLDGRLMAIAPLAERPRDLSRPVPFRSLEFIGTGSVGSDYLDIIVRRGLESEADRALARHLAAGNLMIELRQMRSGSSAARAAAQLEQEGWQTARAVTDACPFIDLAGHSWPSYLGTLSRHSRQNIRSGLKRLGHVFSFDQVKSEGERRESLNRLFALHELRWRARGGSTAFNRPQLLAFHEEMSRIALERGWLRLFVLWVNGVPASSLYGFRYGPRFYYYQLGFDPGFAKQGVGSAAVGLAIERAIEEGAAEFDFLHGTEPYKLRWTKQARELERIELYPPGFKGIRERCLVRLNRAARALARRVRSIASFPR